MFGKRKSLPAQKGGRYEAASFSAPRDCAYLDGEHAATGKLPDCYDTRTEYDAPVENKVERFLDAADDWYTSLQSARVKVQDFVCDARMNVARGDIKHIDTFDDTYMMRSLGCIKTSAEIPFFVAADYEEDGRYSLERCYADEELADKYLRLLHDNFDEDNYFVPEKTFTHLESEAEASCALYMAFMAQRVAELRFCAAARENPQEVLSLLSQAKSSDDEAMQYFLATQIDHNSINIIANAISEHAKDTLTLADFFAENQRSEQVREALAYIALGAAKQGAPLCSKTESLCPLWTNKNLDVEDLTPAIKKRFDTYAKKRQATLLRDCTQRAKHYRVNPFWIAGTSATSSKKDAVEASQQNAVRQSAAAARDAEKYEKEESRKSNERADERPKTVRLYIEGEHVGSIGESNEALDSEQLASQRQQLVQSALELPAVEKYIKKHGAHMRTRLTRSLHDILQAHESRNSTIQPMLLKSAEYSDGVKYRWSRHSDGQSTRIYFATGTHKDGTVEMRLRAPVQKADATTDKKMVGHLILK